MASNVVGSVTPTIDTANADRLTILLIDGGSLALREVLLNQLLNENLQQKKNHVTGLIGTKLTQPQFYVLYPVSGQTPCLRSLSEVPLKFVIKEVLQIQYVQGQPSLAQIIDFLGGNGIARHLNKVKYKSHPSIRQLFKSQKDILSDLGKTKCINDLDITLLSCLLLNFFNLIPTSRKFSQKPNPNAINVADDVLRIRLCRNTLYHRKDAGISKQTFDDCWAEISDVLIRLIGPGFRSELSNLKVAHLDPAKIEECTKLLDEWQRQDTEIKEIIEENTKTVVTEIQKESEHSRTFIEDTVRGSFGELKKENEETKAMISNVTDILQETRAEGQTVVSLLNDQTEVVKGIDMKTTGQNKELKNISQRLSVHTERFETIKQSQEDTKHTVENILGNQISHELAQKLPSDFMKAQVNNWEIEEKRFSETRASKNVFQSLNEKHHVTLKGCPGSGKSTIAKHMCVVLKNEGYHVYPLTDPDKIDHYYAEGLKQVFLFDDPVGEHALDNIQVSNWRKHSEGIKSLLKGSKTKIIATVRSNIINSKELEIAETVLIENIIDISNESLRLNKDERMNMFKSHNPNSRIPYEVETCSYDCFPLLCHVFSRADTDETCLFKNPSGIIKKLFENIKTFNIKQFCGLVLCALIPDLEEDVFDLSIDSEDLENKRKMVDDILIAMEQKPSKSYNIIKDELYLLRGVYVSIVEGVYSFIHTIFKDTVLCVVGESKIGFVFRYYSWEYINQMVHIGRCLPSDKDTGSYLVLPDRENVWIMFRVRVHKDLTQCRFEDILFNPYVSYYNIETAVLEFIERMGPAVNDMRDVYEMNFLQHAVLTNNLTITEYLLRCGGNVNQSVYGNTLLGTAVNHNNMEMVLLLIEYNADIENSSDTIWDEPLHLALMEHNWAVAYLLITIANIDIYDIIKAFNTDNKDLLKLLLQKRVKSYFDSNQNDLLEMYSNVLLWQAEPQTQLKLITDAYQCVKLQGDYSVGLLSVAIKSNRKDIIDAIFTCIPIEPLNEEQKVCIGKLAKESWIEIDQQLSKFGIPLPIMGSYGFSKFISDAVSKNEALEYLLNNGADINDKDLIGTTALSLACKENNLQIVKMLCERNADVNAGSPPAVTSALYTNNIDIWKVLLQHGAYIHDIDSSHHLAVWAASNNNTEMLELLLNYDVNVDGHAEGQDTALIIACRNNTMDMVKMLLNTGADANILGEHSETAIYHALYNKNMELLELLVNSGLDLNLNTTVTIAAWLNNFKMTKFLLQHDVDINLYPEGGDTALVHAASHNNKEFVKLLLKRGSKVNLHEAGRDTALITAAQKADISIVKILLDHGADANITTHSQITALSYAVYRNKIDMVELLLQNTDSKIIMCDKAICEASRHNNLEMVELLLEYGCSANSYYNKRTPLTLALCHNNVSLVQLLLHYSADVKMHDDCPYAALPVAVCNGNLQLVQLLLKHGADVNQHGEEQYTALAEALEDQTMFKLLLKHGADVNIHGKGQESILTLAVSCRLCRLHIKQRTCTFLKKYTSMCGNPLPSNIEPNQLYKSHCCFHRLDSDLNLFNCRLCNETQKSKFVCLKCIEMLIKNGADINQHDEGVDTALIRATYVHNLPVVKLLLENGADVNLQGWSGKTALMIATDLKNLELMQLLLHHHADVNIHDDSRETALIKAIGHLKDMPFRSTVSTHDCQEDFNALEQHSYQESNETPREENKAIAKLIEILIEFGGNVNYCRQSGTTPLIMAIDKHNINLVKLLIKQGAEINSSIAGTTPLIKAIDLLHCDAVSLIDQQEEYINSTMSRTVFRISKPEINVVKLLIQSGADVNLCDYNKNSPLMSAVRVGYVEVVNYLLDCGADVHIKNDDGKTPLSIAFIQACNSITGKKFNKFSELENTMKQQYIRIVHKLLNRNPEITLVGVEREAILKLIAKKGDVELLELLQSFISYENKEVDKCLWQLLYDDDIVQQIDAISIILEHGANVNSFNYYGRIPIIQALNASLYDIEEYQIKDVQQYIALLEMLIKHGADVNSHIGRPYYQTPLQIAIQHNNLDFVILLVNHGADINNQKSLPLSIAVENRNYAMLEFLIKCGSDVNNRGQSSKDIAILRALRNVDYKMVEFLLEHGADINLSGQYTTLTYTVSFNGQYICRRNQNRNALIENTKALFHKDIITFLLDKGADINLPDDDGRTPLVIAVQENNEDLAQWLVNHGSDINFRCRNMYGTITPLIKAVDRRNKRMIKFCLDNKADINLCSENGDSPLRAAIMVENKDMTRYLINQGADMNLETMGKHTPILDCIKKNRIEMIQLLLDLGAHINHKTKSGDTPLSEAVSQNNMEILQLLLHYGADINLCPDTSISLISKAQNDLHEIKNRNTRLGIKGKFHWYNKASDQYKELYSFEGENGS